MLCVMLQQSTLYERRHSSLLVVKSLSTCQLLQARMLPLNHACCSSGPCVRAGSPAAPRWSWAGHHQRPGRSMPLRVMASGRLRWAPCWLDHLGPWAVGFGAEETATDAVPRLLNVQLKIHIYPEPPIHVELQQLQGPCKLLFQLTAGVGARHHCEMSK